MNKKTKNVSQPILEIKELDVYYGASHALQNLNLVLDHGILGVLGRNGMGKTTLCNVLMGLLPAKSGTVLFEGKPILGKLPHEIANSGIGYVPQGRRLWKSLSVHEHLKLCAKRGSDWPIERIYEVFPRLAERKNNGGAQLSGGEQQMLAISRALLQDPKLLILDEPTEGLAPVIVHHVEEVLSDLGHKDGVAILLVEQNISVVNNAAEEAAIMVNGQIAQRVETAILREDKALQQSLLGVG